MISDDVETVERVRRGNCTRREASALTSRALRIYEDDGPRMVPDPEYWYAKVNPFLSAGDYTCATPLRTQRLLTVQCLPSMHGCQRHDPAACNRVSCVVVHQPAASWRCKSRRRLLPGWGAGGNRDWRWRNFWQYVHFFSCRLCLTLHTAGGTTAPLHSNPTLLAPFAS